MLYEFVFVLYECIYHKIIIYVLLCLGVLSGEKQRLGRDYDFSEIVKWFAERADLIIIMFDAHKLDISDELKTVLDTLKPHQDKIRVLLNKADTIDTQSLLRVYGALMWSLGKVVQTPEVISPNSIYLVTK